MTETAKRRIDDLIVRFPELEAVRVSLTDAASLLIRSMEEGGKILLCGNGGSAADADHIVGELMKSFVRARRLPPKMQRRLEEADTENGPFLAANLQPGLPALSLTQHPALSTAYANDAEPQAVFAQQTLVLGRPGDIFWGISTSGNSENVVLAALTARACGMAVLGLTGRDGGKLRELCDVCLRVPEVETYRIQELHLPVYHRLCLILEDHFFGA